MTQLEPHTDLGNASSPPSKSKLVSFFYSPIKIGAVITVIAILSIATIVLLPKIFSTLQSHNAWDSFEYKDLASPRCKNDGSLCQDRFPDGSKIALEITPKPLLASRPLQVRINVDDELTNDIQLSVRGINMDMGQNNFVLSKSAPRIWTGKIIFPVCIAATMQWKILVRIRRSNGNNYLWPIQLETHRPPYFSQ